MQRFRDYRKLPKKKEEKQMKQPLLLQKKDKNKLMLKTRE
tara:strand:+ start:741 stop:860 length:120 start_codon:yes stop_codon:yes gene_type:complete